MKRILLITALIFFYAGLAFGASGEEFKTLESKAFGGNYEAMVELGDLYFAESLRYYVQAAEHGHAGAQYVLGRMYYNETNFSQDFGPKHYFGAGKEDKALARSWYEKAAAQGLGEAQLMLGKIALNDDVDYRPQEEAVKWLTMAAKQKNAEAQRILGLTYRGQSTQPQKAQEMLDWLTLAAEQGDIASMMLLGELYLGQGAISRDYAQSFKWFSAAADQGEARALLELSKMYFGGYGVDADKVTASVLLRQAADDAEMSAIMDKDTTMRAFRDNLQQSLTKEEQARAQKMYTEDVQAKAMPENNAVVTKTIKVVNTEELTAKAKAGDTAAQFELAEHYRDEGLKWYQKAAGAENVLAQRRLGIIYNGESAVAPDIVLSTNWFTLAAANGDTVSQRALGLYVAAGYPDTVGDSAAALKWLTMAAEQGDAEAQYWLSLLYNGESDIPANDELALKWKSAAALQGHPYAQYQLGEYYSRQKNYDEASKWFTAAAELSPPSIQYAVAHKYYAGKDGVAKDFAKAFQLFLQVAQASLATEASNPDNSEYYYMVGYLYLNAQGTRQNYGEALKWFTLAADLGSGKAASQIAEMHRNGQGIRKNSQTAIEWFTKAHDNYDKSAAFTIAQIYARGDGVKPDMDEAQKWFVAAVKSGNEDALHWFGDNPDKVSMRWIAELERTLMVHERDRANLALVQNLIYNMAENGNPEALQRIFSLGGSGDVRACYVLARMYLTGGPLPQNYINAWAWARLAVDQNAKKTEKVFSDELQLLMNAADANMTDFEKSAARENWRLLKHAFNHG